MIPTCCGSRANERDLPLISRSAAAASDHQTYAGLDRQSMVETAAIQQVGETEEIPDLGIYCGSATPELARLVAERLGRPLGRRDLNRFPDGESHVQILD